MTNLSDKPQRTDAINPFKSFIVQAPAGSGKTSLLTQRFLVLLAQVKNPEEVLAITFTRKAATEMRHRILTALHEAKDQREALTEYELETQTLAMAVLAKDKELDWNLLNNPHRLRIQTIDALCANLASQMPIVSQFGINTAIADEPEQLYQQASQQLLQGLDDLMPWQSALQNLLAHLDNNLLLVENLFVKMLGKREQWLPYILKNRDISSQKNRLEEGLKQLARESIQKISSTIPENLTKEIREICYFSATQQKIKLKIFENLDFNFTPNKLDEHLEFWQFFANLCLTKDFQWRKVINKNSGFPSAQEAENKDEKALYQTMKQRMQNLLVQINTQDSLLTAFEDILILPPIFYSTIQWSILVALVELLPVLAAQLLLVFQEHAKVDFTEIALRAINALGQETAPTDLALNLDHQLQHILVDEFQDTSNLQFRLIENLTAGWQNEQGKTLFLVGDPMQSIYRFRAAEVGLFLRARKSGIGNISLIPLQLNTNFRSQKNIVAWNNKTFAKIFPTQENIASGAVPYAASFAQKEEIAAETAFMHALINAEPSETAEHILKIIQQTQISRPEDNIAILVRARQHLFDIVPYLKLKGISFQAVEMDNLSQSQTIQDLWSLTRAMYHPGDRIAWLAVLRAPWCGLTLHDLHALAAQNHDLCLWDCILNSETNDSISQDGRFRLNKIKIIFSYALRQKYRSSAKDWIKGVWLALGGPACLSSSEDLTIADIYFDLLEKNSQAGDISNFSQIESQLSRLFSPANSAANNKLQIMTIHKAKGLEFDTVIIPGLERKPANDDKQLLMWMERPRQEGNNDLILAPINAVAEEEDKIYQYLRSENRKKAYYEAMRLFYVATTRAKKSLYLIANLNEDENGVIKTTNNGSFLSFLWQTYENDFIQFRPQTASASSQPGELKKLLRLPLNWEFSSSYPKFQTPTTINFAHNPQNVDIKLKWEPSYEKELGTVFHFFLQAMANQGLKIWQGYTSEDLQTRIETVLKRQGMFGIELEYCCQRITRGITNILSDGKAEWIFANHQSAQAEFPLSAEMNGEVKHFIIDRTFIDEKDTRWIIDYKTAEPQNEDIDGFIVYQKQLHQQQLETYAKVFKGMERREIKLGLYFPMIPHWFEW